MHSKLDVLERKPLREGWQDSVAGIDSCIIDGDWGTRGAESCSAGTSTFGFASLITISGRTGRVFLSSMSNGKFSIAPT